MHQFHIERIFAVLGAAIFLVIASSGCGGDDHKPSAPDAGEAQDSSTDSDLTDGGEPDPETDSGEPDTETDGGGPDTETDGGSSVCDDGLPAHAFVETAEDFAYDKPAPDFSLTTTEGVFTLSEAWTGCDNYVFVMYRPEYGEEAEMFWFSDVSELIDDSADNTHYFFVTTEDTTESERESRVRGIESNVDAYLETKETSVQKHWRERFHYVVDYGWDVPPINGVLGQSYNEIHFTIDRHQLVREGHNVSYYAGAWIMELRNTRYWSKYYNAQYKLDQRLAEEKESEDVLVRRVVERMDITAQEPFTWILPDAETIAKYGSLEVDMRLDCPGEGHPYSNTCGEWDTVGSLWLCGDADCTAEQRRRTVKWITPYSSPGRWLIDITPELVSLAKGGETRFMAAHGDNNVGAYTYKYTVDFRFSKSSDGLLPFATEMLIPVGSYAFATMDEAFEPFSVTPPAGTKKVELYARISGHGSEENSGCAEFCTFEHTFDVNGTPHAHTYLMENENRCAEWVEQGVTPNQGGTWHFDRSSWCPGFVTEEWREDLTDSFDLTGTNAIVHIPTYQGGPPPGGNMDARVELVFYR